MDCDVRLCSHLGGAEDCCLTRTRRSLAVRVLQSVAMEVDGKLCVQMGEYCLYFEDSQNVGEAFEERALKELRETPARRERAMDALRDLVRGRLHTFYSLLFGEVYGV